MQAFTRDRFPGIAAREELARQTGHGPCPQGGILGEQVTLEEISGEHTREYYPVVFL